MDRNRVKHVAEVESTASQGAGLLELWDGASQIVWHHTGVCRFSAASEQFGAEPVQRLREWCYNADDKKGEKRWDLDVSTCFGPLLQWLLAWWPADQPRLALALDATTLKKRFTVLVISVVYRGCAIPVAWKVVGAEQKGAWKPHWMKLLEKLLGSVPAHWTVIVMSDRGLYAPWLYGKIVSVGWHPFMRINKQGNFRPQGEGKFRSLAQLRPGGQRLVWASGLFLWGDVPIAVYLVGSLG